VSSQQVGLSRRLPVLGCGCGVTARLCVRLRAQHLRLTRHMHDMAHRTYSTIAKIAHSYACNECVALGCVAAWQGGGVGHGGRVGQTESSHEEITALTVPAAANPPSTVSPRGVLATTEELGGGCEWSTLVTCILFQFFDACHRYWNRPHHAHTADQKS
jgi:hypothetical protein